MAHVNTSMHGLKDIQLVLDATIFACHAVGLTRRQKKS